MIISKERAILSLNSLAKFYIVGSDIDDCEINWLEDTTPIAKADIKTEMQRDLPNLQERDIDQLLDGLRDEQLVRIVNAISKFTVNLGNLATFIEAMLSPNMCKQCSNVQTTPTGNTSTPI